MGTFICTYSEKSWIGCITMFKDYGTHYEFKIQSRSNIMVIFGKTSRGYFACIPDLNAGCHLSNLNDAFWNTQRLSAVLDKVDSVTVASALLYLYKELEYPEF